MRIYRNGARLAAALLIALPLAGCSDLLEVTDPDVVTPEQAAGPDNVPLVLAGMIGDFQEAIDDLVLYEALFTDEMILSGTFPTRIDVDERNVVQDPDNGSLAGDVFQPLQIARETADRNLAAWQEALTDPDFEPVLEDVEEGLALANLYSGYTRLYMAELYCAVIAEPEGAPLTPDEAAAAALDRFVEAESLAEEFELPDIAEAARVAQSRALVWLDRYDEAAAVAAEVDPQFTYFSFYSGNEPDQYNEVYAFTWADSEEARWTVGDGTAGNRHNERFTYYDEWLAQGLLLPNPPGIDAPEIGVPITLQLLYDDRPTPILIASGWEAQMIIAENELRSGSPEAAETRVNALLTDPSMNPMVAVNPDLAETLGAFQPVDFTGNLQTDLPQLARARLAGLWLSGTRQPTLRRFAAEDGVDLYPQNTQGDDIYFPIPQDEIDNNPNVSEACPV